MRHLQLPGLQHLNALAGATGVEFGQDQIPRQVRVVREEQLLASEDHVVTSALAPDGRRDRRRRLRIDVECAVAELLLAFPG
jgi:hypothetical protein